MGPRGEGASGLDIHSPDLCQVRPEHLSVVGGKSLKRQAGPVAARQRDAAELGHHVPHHPPLHSQDRVGTELKEGLTTLMDHAPIIGDVRGRGLFLGIEFVRSRDGREPAAAEATYAVERMKQHGILLSTDGPDHNVIKIKPPLAFTTGDAERLVTTLTHVLEDSALRG